MHTAIVVPCLNEEATLALACHSLGFGGQDIPPSDTVLILVDNGSTDRTVEVMEEIRCTSPSNVILARESERGYVPPRHRGVLVASNHANNCGHPENEVLILQADADTIYDRNYVSEMRQTAKAKPKCIIEGVTRTRPTFLAAHPGFFHLATIADRATEKLIAGEDDDIIIDDKVAGYRLSDYLAWGGHRREYDRYGDEIHAETSRLYLRGKTRGAERIRAVHAGALPSRRKVESDPLLYFATSGFPREARWCHRWQVAQGKTTTLDMFDLPDAEERFEEAIFVRQAHNLVLFNLLPTCVAILRGRGEVNATRASPLSKLATEISKLIASDISSHPGRLFELSFKMIESHRYIFKACI